MEVVTLGSRIVTLLLALAGIVVWAGALRRNPKYKNLAVSLIGLCVHTALFYVVVMLLDAPPQVLNLWSMAIRCHGLILIFTGGLLIGRAKWTSGL